MKQQIFLKNGNVYEFGITNLLTPQQKVIIV